MGPFKIPPFNSLHCSPMLTRPKVGSTNSRVIVDLRWPHGKSVNDMVCNNVYLGTNFKLKFPSVDDITARVQKLDGNCLLYKIIVHLEMIIVFIALNLWKHKLQGRTIVIHCDNMAIVNSISSGRSWDSFLGRVARNIWLLTATHDIELTVLHIPAGKIFVQTRCRGGIGAGYQGKWRANCFNSHGVT